MIKLALNSALSDRASEGRVALIDEWSFAAPRTKDAVAALSALELTGRVLIVIGPDDGIADRSFANLQRIQTLQVSELNAYDILKSDWIVFTDATVPGETESAPATATKAPARRASAAKKAAAVDDSPDEDTDAITADASAADDTGSDEAQSDEAQSDDAGVTDEGSDQ
jgi:large subunit ribosomal protein L4